MKVKMSKQPPPAAITSAVGPRPTVIKIVGLPGTGSLSCTFALLNHPRGGEYEREFSPSHLGGRGSPPGKFGKS